ncbi:MAG TPA: thermonuclease family protein [Xanthobacteraceae bacterium]|nr:thermonuclease family protein [Xanthobacteraceae bacterium]
MIGWRDGVLAGGLSAMFAMCGGVCAEPQQRPIAVACGGDVIAQATVSRVIDGRTFVLDDGREVRLAAIEVPQPGNDSPPGGAAAKDALVALAGGDMVMLRQAQAPSDRYQRLLAYAYAVRDGEELFTQGEMISSGLARVGDHVGSRTCAAELLRREAMARSAKLGLWADSYYDVLNAETPADVLAHRGRFALVEGKVVSVRESGSTIYINFGRRWSEDFAVTVLKRNERIFAAAGLDLQKLAGRRIRVRGWVEQRGGAGAAPWIEAAYPEQIETAGN